jgi:hypothetical protein
VEEIQRPFTVHADGIKGMVPRSSNITPPAEVIDDVGPNISNEFVHGSGVKKVGAVSTVHTDNGVALAEKVRAKVSTNKSCGTGYKRSHDFTLCPSSVSKFEEGDEFVR